MRAKLPPLALAALGVVFGDIGTSPLYAFGLCFKGDYPAPVARDNIIGILSLIFWALIIVVCVKYVTFMLRADNNGQGGTIALLALINPKTRAGLPSALTAIALLVLFGEATLYGDGAITPAISVISAIEGLDVWTQAAHRLIVPLSVVILIGLFVWQRRGTGEIGKLFGPVMLIWFLAIGIAGAIGIVAHPNILIALNPVYSWAFFLHHGLLSVLIMGAVVLCVTGVEALYADLAHFGRRPITMAWYIGGATGTGAELLWTRREYARSPNSDRKSLLRSLSALGNHSDGAVGNRGHGHCIAGADQRRLFAHATSDATGLLAAVSYRSHLAGTRRPNLSSGRQCHARHRLHLARHFVPFVCGARGRIRSSGHNHDDHQLDYLFHARYETLAVDAVDRGAASGALSCRGTCRSYLEIFRRSYPAVGCLWLSRA